MSRARALQPLTGQESELITHPSLQTFTGMGNMHFKIGNLHDIYL